MTRLRVWTGSRWSDVSVWTGTQWKGFTDYVYGSEAFVDNMDSMNGWTGSGYGDPGYSPIWNAWEGGVIYVDYDAAPYGLDCKIYKDWAANAYTFEAPPSTEIRCQASIWFSIVTGDGNEQDKRTLYLSAELVDTGGYSQTVRGEFIIPALGTNAWWTFTSTVNYTTPANSDKPVSLYLKNFTCRYDGGGLAVPPNPPTVRMHVNWARLIGPDGNPLKKKIADAVHGIKAWNGSAWV